MKFIKLLAVGTFAFVGLGFLTAPSAQAGTRVNISIGGGGGYYRPAYYPRPVAYCPPPVYSRPVVYQPAYYPAPRRVYYQPAYRPAYRQVNYGYGRPSYYGGCR